MAGRITLMQFSGTEVLVETTAVAGSEPTSKLGDTADRVVDVFDRAKTVIMGVAGSTADMVSRIKQGATTTPSKVEVEFGLGFSAKGNVIIAGGQADATVKVKLTYDTNSTE